jgi:hypothetical protein
MQAQYVRALLVERGTAAAEEAHNSMLAVSQGLASMSSSLERGLASNERAAAAADAQRLEAQYNLSPQLWVEGYADFDEGLKQIKEQEVLR